MVICCKFKKKMSSTFDFIHILSWFSKCIYNAITQNICLVKGLHKYDVYLSDKNKAYLNWSNKDRITIFIEHNVI